MSETDIEVVTNFDNMNLKEDLLRGIYGYGFETPSAIQQKAIMQIIKGVDLIAQAQSGTGKTGAFCIGALEKIDIKKRDVQVIILSPTKELARQTLNVFESLGEYMNISATLMVGGINIDQTKKQLSYFYISKSTSSPNTFMILFYMTNTCDHQLNVCTHLSPHVEKQM